jgi:hypothetical protein
VVDNFKINIKGVELCSKESDIALGVIIDRKLHFDDNLSDICKRAANLIKSLLRLPKVLSVECKLNIYNTFIMANFAYCSLVWHICGNVSTHKIQAIQKRGLRYVFDYYDNDIKDLMRSKEKTSLYVIRLRKLLLFVYDVLNENTPAFLYGLFKKHDTTYDLRDENRVELPRYHSITYGKKTLCYAGAKLYNELPDDLKKCTCRKEFKTNVSKWMPKCQCGFCLSCKYT